MFIRTIDGFATSAKWTTSETRGCGGSTGDSYDLKEFMDKVVDAKKTQVRTY